MVENPTRDEIEIYNPEGRRTHRGMLSRSRTVGYDEPISIACSLVSMVSVSMGLAHPRFLPPWPPFTLSALFPYPSGITANFRVHTPPLPIACAPAAPCKSFGLSLLRFFTALLRPLFATFPHFRPIVLVAGNLKFRSVDRTARGEFFFFFL